MLSLISSKYFLFPWAKVRVKDCKIALLFNGSILFLVQGDTPSKSDTEIEEINVLLITEEIDKNEILLAETTKLAVADRVCTKILAGEEWYTNYIKDLSDKLKHQVKIINFFIKTGRVKEKIPSCSIKVYLKKLKELLIWQMIKFLIKKLIYIFPQFGIIALVSIHPKQSKKILKKYWKKKKDLTNDKGNHKLLKYMNSSCISR